MEDPNSNQDQRRGRAPTREGQATLSESHSRRREDDRCRRQRNVLHAQQDLSLHRMPMPPTFPAISPIQGRQRDNSEDEPIGDSALMSTQTHYPAARMRVMSSSPTNDPVIPSYFQPVPHVFSGGNLEDVLPIQGLGQTIRPNTIESQDAPLAVSPHTVILPVRQGPPTTTADAHSPEIIRLKNIFRAANSTLSLEAFSEDQTLQKYIEWGFKLVDVLNYENITQYAKLALAIMSTDPSPSTVDTNEQTRDTTISPEIYRLLLKMNQKIGRSKIKKNITDTIGYFEISRYFATEISCRPPVHPSRSESCTARIIEDVKFDFACANSGLSKPALLTLRETSQRDYAKVIEPIDKIYQSCSTIQSFVDEIGTPAALLIWPLLRAQKVTGLLLHQLPVAFVSGMAQFIKGSHEFPAIQSLINHMSIWVDGWVMGAVRADVAGDYLERFTRCGVSPGDDFGSLSMYDVLTSFTTTWRLRGLPSPTVGKLGSQVTFIATDDLNGFDAARDFGAFCPAKQLNENVVAGVLATTNLPTNITFCRASQYGSCYDDGVFTIDRAMAIDPEATTILCPVYTGMSNHWIGVVVRLTRMDVGRHMMMFELLDSHIHELGGSLYDEKIVMAMILTWLRNRLPDYKRFVIPSLMVRRRVAQETAINSCGVHTLANLIAAGTFSDYPTDSSEEWVDAQRYQYLAQTLRSAAENLRLESGRQFIKTTLINFVDNHKKPGQWGEEHVAASTNWRLQIGRIPRV